jgi:asparagine synthase (glutamine-hydrolysing)
MPGTNLYASALSISARASLLKEVQERMLHFSGYEHKDLLEDRQIYIGITAYADYPFLVWKTESIFALLEGHVYKPDISEVRDGLRSLGEKLKASIEDARPEVSKLVQGWDGEYVVTIVARREGRLLIFNDLLGRLPLFYYKTEKEIAVSREAKFILPLLADLDFDRKAISEYLLFGFPFRDGTLINKCCQLLPSNCISFDPGEGIHVKSTFALNLSEPMNSRDRSRLVWELKDTLMEVLSARSVKTSDRLTIVSLSGGLDSRAVLGGLKVLGASPIAVTLEGEEQKVAKEVAGALGTPVDIIKAEGPADSSAMGRIVFLGDGLDCHSNLVQLHSNLRFLARKYGTAAIYYTGIFGGEITRFAAVTSGLESIESLAKYLLSGAEAYTCSAANVAEVLQITEASIEHSLVRRLSEFEATSASEVYKYFRMEYNTRFVGGGEDRNRYYFWTVSPFASASYLSKALDVPTKERDLRFFRDMLHEINPRLCDIAYFNYRIPLSNSLVLFGLSGLQRLVRNARIKAGVRKVLRFNKRFWNPIRMRSSSHERTEELRSGLIKLVDSSMPVLKFFGDPNALKRVINLETDCQALERLMIVASYIDEATRWRSLFPIVGGSDGNR